MNKFKILKVSRLMNKKVSELSSFMNGVFFHRMGFGDRKTTIAVAIEPLTQAD